MRTFDDYDELVDKSDIMVFRPTMEEFADFPKYIEYMEEQGAHEYGIAKIIPPKEWSPCKNMRLKLSQKNIVINHPVLQEISSTHSGIYQQMNIEQNAISLELFEDMAKSPEYGPPNGNIARCEERYWRGLPFKSALYGADVSGSLYDNGVKEWNISALEDVLNSVTRELKIKIPGVNTPYLYFGMWKTTFPWHVEDMDLYSINYLHYGEPKFWYGIPQSHGKRFETMIKGVYPDFFKVCPQFLRHKMTIVSPKNLAKSSIPVNRMVQREGEFMITFPNGYHSGFNMGYNAAESINFALHRWLEIGKKAQFCLCFLDTVSINMNDFIDKYNEYYQQDVEKVPLSPCQKKKQEQSEDQHIGQRMRPRRKLCSYASAHNTRARARKEKFRRKMGYKRRKIKRIRSHDLIKKHRKNAILRNLFIDPPPELSCDILLDSDTDHYPTYLPTPLIKITATTQQLLKSTTFPTNMFVDTALVRMENDFTLRAEDVPLRENRPRQLRENRPRQPSSSRSRQRQETEQSLEVNVTDWTATSTVDWRDTDSESRQKHESNQTVDSLDWTETDSVVAVAGSPVKQRISVTPEKRKAKKNKIDLDVPSSLLSPDSSNSSHLLSPTSIGVSMDDIFSEIVEGDLFEKENRRRTRKNKGGRPRKFGFDSTISESQLAKQKSTGKCKGRPVSESLPTIWDTSCRGPSMSMPPDRSESVQLEQYNDSSFSFVDEERSSDSSHIGDEYLFEDGSYLQEVEVEDSSFSDWRLMMIQNKAKLNKAEKKKLYLKKKQSKPTFGSHGPSLNQAKVQKMNAEQSMTNSNKRNLVKLKDLIIYDKKFISAFKNNGAGPQRDKLGRLKIQQPCAISNVDCMRRVMWIFDHNYGVANTNVSPPNIVTVPVGDGRYKVIKVYAKQRQTKSFTGRSFVNDHAKWPTKLLSMGHNIMAIFNYQAYSQTGFSFDDTTSHPEPSVVRDVTPNMCRKILAQRAHILENKKKEQLSPEPEQHAPSSPADRGKRKLTKPPVYRQNGGNGMDTEYLRTAYNEIFMQPLREDCESGYLPADYLNQPSSRADYPNQPSSRADYLNQPSARADYLNQPSSRADYLNQPSSSSIPHLMPGPLAATSDLGHRIRVKSSSYVPDIVHVQSLSNLKSNYSGYDPKYVFSSFDFDEPDDLPTSNPHPAPRPNPNFLNSLNHNYQSAPAVSVPTLTNQTYNVSKTNHTYNVNKIPVSTSDESNIDSFCDYINQYSALTTHKVMPDSKDKSKRNDRLWTVPNPLDPSLMKISPNPTDQHPLHPHVEKTIEWSIKRRNVDNFRVWPNDSKANIWTPKDPPDPFSRTGLRVVQAHEYYNPNRYSRIQPCLHAPGPGPNSSILAADLKRKEEQRKFREQQINNIPMLKDPRLLPTNNSLPVNDLSSYYKERIQVQNASLDPVDVMEELFRRGAGPPNSGIRSRVRIPDVDDSADPFKFKCSNFTKSSGTRL